MATKFKRYVIRPIRDRIVYCFFILMYSTLYIMPRRPILWWHGKLSGMAFKIMGNIRKQTIQHLKYAYGNELSDTQCKQIARKMFESLSKTFTDYAFFSRMHTREEFSRYFKFEGEEHLRAAYERGKGVLCMIPHTPGWEFSAIMPPIMGYKSLGVSSRLKNKKLNEFAIRMRESRGMRDVIREQCYDELVRSLKAGECLIIMIDQDSMRVRGEFVNFFGKPAYTPIGCARLAQETGAAVVPMATIRNDETNSYTFKIWPEIPYEDYGDTTQNYIRNTQKYNDIIEKIIRQNPEQWVWLHKRWNTTPELLAAYLEDRRATKAKKLLQQQKTTNNGQKL